MLKNIKSIIYKIYIILNQRYYKMSNGKKLKYILIKNKSNKLIISFSGFPGEKGTAKYNYIRTLKDCNENKIFILDDFGYDKKGSYYLGENGEYFLQEEIVSLINKIKNENNIKEVYTLGTSKGGWAALYYGIKLKCDMIVSGAPQYYIGNYLNENEYHKKILKGITGEITDNKIEQLNNLLPSLIESSNLNNTRFIIHYSKNEHTYNEHIIFLLKKLKSKYSNSIQEDIQDYEEHSEVGIFFKDLLKRVL